MTFRDFLKKRKAQSQPKKIQPATRSRSTNPVGARAEIYGVFAFEVIPGRLTIDRHPVQSDPRIGLVMRPDNLMDCMWMGRDPRPVEFASMRSSDGRTLLGGWIFIPPSAIAWCRQEVDRIVGSINTVSDDNYFTFSIASPAGSADAPMWATQFTAWNCWADHETSSRIGFRGYARMQRAGVSIRGTAYAHDTEVQFKEDVTGRPPWQHFPWHRVESAVIVREPHDASVLPPRPEILDASIEDQDFETMVFAVPGDAESNRRIWLWNRQGAELESRYMPDPEEGTIFLHFDDGTVLEIVPTSVEPLDRWIEILTAAGIQIW